MVIKLSSLLSTDVRWGGVVDILHEFSLLEWLLVKSSDLKSFEGYAF